MEPEDKAVLAANIDFLIECTENEDLLIEELIHRNVLSGYLADEIKRFDMRNERIRCLYEEIQSRGPVAFEHLLSALVFTANDRIADKLNRDARIRRRHEPPFSEYLKVKVVKAQERLDIKNDMQNPATWYKMGSRPKGLALIINIHDFDKKYFTGQAGEEVRAGSFRDVANLYSLFDQLGYRVMMYYNLTREQIKRRVKTFAKMREHADVDSTVVVMMSHNGRGDNSFLSHDSFDVHCERDIVAEFNSLVCPKLKGKPKVFIFQICRGDGRDFGTTFSSSEDQNDATRSKSALLDSTGSSSAVPDANSFHTGCCSSSSSSSSSLPPVNSPPLVPPPPSPSREATFKDILQIHSTTFDHFSLRDPFLGSYFVQNLCSVFAEHAHKWDLSNLLIEVTNCMHQRYDNLYGIQTPQITATGNFGKLYFNPGLYDDSPSVNDIDNCAETFTSTTNDNCDAAEMFTFSNRGRVSNSVNANNSSQNTNGIKSQCECESHNISPRLDNNTQEFGSKTISFNNSSSIPHGDCVTETMDKCKIDKVIDTKNIDYSCPVSRYCDEMMNDDEYEANGIDTVDENLLEIDDRKHKSTGIIDIECKNDDAMIDTKNINSNGRYCDEINTLINDLITQVNGVDENDSIDAAQNLAREINNLELKSNFKTPLNDIDFNNDLVSSLKKTVQSSRSNQLMNKNLGDNSKIDDFQNLEHEIDHLQPSSFETPLNNCGHKVISGSNDILVSKNLEQASQINNSAVENSKTDEIFPENLHQNCCSRSISSDCTCKKCVEVNNFNVSSPRLEKNFADKVDDECFSCENSALIVEKSQVTNQIPLDIVVSEPQNNTGSNKSGAATNDHPVFKSCNKKSDSNTPGIIDSSSRDICGSVPEDDAQREGSEDGRNIYKKTLVNCRRFFRNDLEKRSDNDCDSSKKTASCFGCKSCEIC